MNVEQRRITVVLPPKFLLDLSELCIRVCDLELLLDVVVEQARHCTIKGLIVAPIFSPIYPEEYFHIAQELLQRCIRKHILVKEGIHAFPLTGCRHACP